MMDAPKKGVALIVDRIPPPGARKDAEPDPGDNSGDDYSAAEDSMAAFIDAVKAGDPAKALDAYHDVMRNCAPESDTGE